MLYNDWYLLTCNTHFNYLFLQASLQRKITQVCYGIIFPFPAMLDGYRIFQKGFLVFGTGTGKSKKDFPLFGTGTGHSKNLSRFLGSGKPCNPCGKYSGAGIPAHACKETNRNGQKQTEADRNGQKWTETDRNGQKWPETDRNIQKQTKTDSNFQV